MIISLHALLLLLFFISFGDLPFLIEYKKCPKNSRKITVDAYKPNKSSSKLATSKYDPFGDVSQSRDRRKRKGRHRRYGIIVFEV